MCPDLIIRDLQPAEQAPLGRLLVQEYAQLPGFPRPQEQPEYYRLLADVAQLARRPATRVLVAVTAAGDLLGGVVYIGDMAQYGSGGTAPQERRASGIRLLVVDPAARGRGVGRVLTQSCLDLARSEGQAQVILHTTEAMQVAWGLYLRMGFLRSPDLDFQQGALPVFGFRLSL